MNKYSDTIIIIVFLSLPLLLGAVVYFFKIQKVVSWVETINGWLIEKNASVAERQGFVSRWFFRPLLWGLLKIMNISEEVSDQYLKTAIRTSAYLYFAGLLTYIGISIIIIIAIIGITFFLIDIFTSDSRSYSTSTVSTRIRGTDLHDTRGIFKKRVGRVDNDGNIYDTTGIFEKQVGRVDEDGRILDTKGIFAKEEARIDGDGNVYDTTGIFEKQVGHVDEDGTVTDTRGIFNKQIGKADKK